MTTRKANLETRLAGLAHRIAGMEYDLNRPDGRCCYCGGQLQDGGPQGECLASKKCAERNLAYCRKRWTELAAQSTRTSEELTALLEDARRHRAMLERDWMGP